MQQLLRCCYHLDASIHPWCVLLYICSIPTVGSALTMYLAAKSGNTLAHSSRRLALQGAATLPLLRILSAVLLRLPRPRARASHCQCNRSTSLASTWVPLFAARCSLFAVRCSRIFPYGVRNGRLTPSSVIEQVVVILVSIACLHHCLLARLCIA
jgi:hypothetical protein